MTDAKDASPTGQADAGAAAAVPALATGTAAAAAATAAAAAQSAAAPGTGAATAASAGPATGAAAAGAATAASKPKKSKAKAKAAPVLTAEEAAALAVQQAAETAALEARRAIEDIPHQQMVKARRMDGQFAQCRRDRTPRAAAEWAPTCACAGFLVDLESSHRIALVVVCVAVLFRPPVQGRNAALVSSVSTLQAALRKSEQDSTDVLHYLEAEVRRKDLVTKRLTREIRDLHAAQVAEKAERGARHAAEIAALEEGFARAEKELLDLHRLRHQEHNDLQLFARIRGDLVAELAATKRVILRNQKRHELQMADLERKFLAARSRLLQESVARIEASRAAYKEEVGRELDLESKWIQVENEKMGQELGFHQALVERLQAANAELAAVVAQLEDGLRALERRDTSHAAAALRDAKVAAELQAKCALLDASIAKVKAEAGEQARAQQQQQARPASDPALVPLHAELAKLEALSAQKSRENGALQRQLALFHSQQNDVERAALDALRRVKREVVARRKAEYAAAVRLYRQQLDQLADGMYKPRGAKLAARPALSASGGGGAGGGAGADGTLHIQSDPRVAPPAPPAATLDSRVTLDELTLHDRERVLHLLFEALNQTAAASGPGAAPAAAAATSAENSRPSSALSLYTGGGRRSGSGSASASSLVVSRPHSSNRSRPGSRPLSSTMRAAAAASAPHHPGSAAAAAAARSRAPPSGPASVAQVDMRPSEFAQLSGLSAAAGGFGRGQRLQQRRSVDEKETSFFPPRGDTPTELL